MTIVPAEVLLTYTDTSLSKQNVVLGAASLTAGMPVYKDASDGQKVKAARANSADTDDVAGILLTNGGDEQDGIILTSGDYDPGFTVGVGKIYVLSEGAAGAIAPVDDISNTGYVTIIGVGITASRLRLSLCTSGVISAAAVA